MAIVEYEKLSWSWNVVKCTLMQYTHMVRDFKINLLLKKVNYEINVSELIIRERLQRSIETELKSYTNECE
jgi:hypothetical protein